MKDTVYIVLSQRGARRMVKGRPALEADEIAVRMRISVPDKAFRDCATVDVNIPEDAILVPEVEAEVEPAQGWPDAMTTMKYATIDTLTDNDLHEDDTIELSAFHGGQCYFQACYNCRDFGTIASLLACFRSHQSDGTGRWWHATHWRKATT